MMMPSQRGESAIHALLIVSSGNNEFFADIKILNLLQFILLCVDKEK
jgi:hypothetical protein